MDRPVTSPQNERVKRVRRLVRDADARRAEGCCVVEGLRGVQDYLATGLPVELALLAPRLDDLPGGSAVRDELARRLQTRPSALVGVTDSVLASAADTPAPQGVLLVVARPAPPDLPAPGLAPLLVAWEIGDPGNVGTLVRTAEAAGCAGLVLARDDGPAADPYGPRAVRASAGSAFRCPPVDLRGPASDVKRRLAAAGFTLVACVMQDGASPESIDLTAGVALLVGSETRGLPAALTDGALPLTIPLAPGAESLNVAAAAAVVAFEAARQRRLAGRQGSC